MLGAGRARNGLGPFLIRFLEEAGVRVVAIAGRDLGRTQELAEVLARRHGHAVAACPDPRSLAQVPGLDAYVVAAPIPAHRAGLEAALAAGLPVLAEKPLLAPEEHDLVPDLLDRFAARRLLLVENCPWPEVLAELAPRWPEAFAPPLRRLELRLSPTQAGREMLVDSLSHLLSLLQALVPVDAGTAIRDLRWSGRGAASEAMDLEFVAERPFAAVVLRLLLRRVPEQPRPAWLEVNGVRLDRTVALPDYAMSFAGAGRSLRVGDPLRALVYGFARSVREDAHERTRRESDAIRQRARLYQAIVRAHDQG